MTTAGIRSLLAATAIAAVLSYSLSGHALLQLDHDGMIGAGAGLCLLLAAALGCLAAPKPEADQPTPVTDAAPTYLGPPPDPPLDGRARASPPALQRFLN
jgi:hypothetical protein